MRNVPLDNSYNHTVKFATKTAQELYFSGVNVVKYTFQQVSYQRTKRNYAITGTNRELIRLQLISIS